MSKEILRKFFHYVSANIISMIGLSLYILVDTYFISKGLGANGLTALNLAVPVYNIVNGMGLLISIGGAAIFIQFHATGENEKAQNVFSHTLVIGLILGLIFAAIGLFFSAPLVRLLGADESIFPMANIYLKVIMLFAPAFILNDILSAITKNDEAPTLAMYGMLLGALFNIIFDYIFIFILHLGMLGAVLATGGAPFVGIILLSSRILSSKSSITFSMKDFHFQPHILARISSLGLSSFINEVAGGLVMIVFNFLILDLAGNIGVAAYGVIGNIYLVVVAIFTGLAQGVQPLTGQYFARKEKKHLDSLLKLTLLTGLVLSILLYGICFFFAEPIVSIFNAEGSALLSSLAIPGMKLYFLAIPFMGLNIILSMYFVSIGSAMPSQIITLLRGVLILIPSAIFMAMAFQMTGVWLSLTLTEVLTNGIALILCKVHLQKGKEA